MEETTRSDDLCLHCGGAQHPAEPFDAATWAAMTGLPAEGDGYAGPPVQRWCPVAGLVVSRPSIATFAPGTWATYSGKVS